MAKSVTMRSVKAVDEAEARAESMPLVSSGMKQNGHSGGGSGIHGLAARYGISQSLLAGGCFCLASGSMVGIPLMHRNLYDDPIQGSLLVLFHYN